MNKIRLRLDDLRVTTFDAEAARRSVGTARGYDEASPEASGEGDPTCDPRAISCRGTRYYTCDVRVASCAETCEPTCDRLALTCGGDDA